MHELKPGDEIGGLRVVRELGRGGFGRVYLALDPLIARQVAIKIIPGDGAQAGSQEYDQILTEARAVGKLSHENIVVLHRVQTPEQCGAWLLEMEYVAGGSLADLLGDGNRLDAARAESVFGQLADALEYAHREGIVHGDVKPGNVLLTPEGRVKLTDFGLARLVGDASASFEVGGGFQGTAHYAAPEVGMGERATAASDLWGLGVVLYEMLSGRRPFAQRDLAMLFYEIQNAEPPALPGGIPPGLAHAVEALLRKEPGRRTIVRGRAGLPPVDVSRLAPRPEGRIARPSLVGRRGETQRLGTWLDAGAGRPEASLCVLRGEAGVGKTTLGRWVAAEAQERGRSVLVVTANPLEGLLRPLLGAVRERLEALDAAPGSEVLTSVSATLRELLEERPSTRWNHVREAHWAVEQALRELAGARPVLLWVEDARHLSREDVGLLLHLSRHIPAAEVRVLVALRTGAAAGDVSPERARGLRELTSASHALGIELEPLGEDDAYALLLETFSCSAIDPRLGRDLLSIAGGNPLHLVEVARHLQESGLVAVHERRVVPTARWREGALPQRLRDLMQARLVPLAEEDRDLLDVAAVLGVEFAAEPIAKVLDRRLLEVLRTLQRLIRDRKLIVPRERGYAFSHALLRETIHADLAPTLSAELHRLIAAHFEALPGPERPTPDVMAWHWEQAGDHAQARGYLLEACLQACRHQELHRAIDFAERASLRPEAIADDEFLEREELFLGLAGIYSDANLPDHADAILRRLAEVADARDDPALALRAQVRRAGLRFHVRGLTPEEVALLTRAEETLPPGLDRGRAAYALGRWCKYAGKLEEAERHATLAREAYAAKELAWLRASAVNLLASVHERRGDLAVAERLYREAAVESSRVGQHLNAAISETNSAMSALGLGRAEEARDTLRRALRRFEREGAVLQACQVLANLADAHLALGEGAEAAACIDRVLATLPEGAYPLPTANLLVRAAFFRQDQGRLGEARDLLERARNAADGAGYVRGQARCALAHARACGLAGREADLAEGLSAARALLASTDDAALAREYDDACAELALYGLRAAGAELERPLLAGDEPSLGACLRARDEPDRMEECLDRWEREPGAESRAFRGVVLALLRASLAARSGDGERARATGARACDEARRLGHVWLELAALRAGAPVEPGRREALRTLLAEAGAPAERWGL